MSTAAGNAAIHGDRGLLVRLVYLTVAAVWVSLRLVTAIVRGAADEVVVLCYHGVLPRQRRAFTWQMEMIAARCVDIGQSLRPDRYTPYLPRVCVTFDDAYANLLENALPVTSRLRIPVIIFAVAGRLGQTPTWSMPPGHPDAGERMMTSAELVTATGVGFCRLGSHTMTHKALAECDPQTIASECEQSKQVLQEQTGQHIEDLALPYGSCNDQVLATALAAGYRRVHTLQPHLNHIGDDGAIGRFSMTPDAWRVEFLLACAGGYAWLHAWRCLVQRLRTSVGPRRQQRLSTA